MRKLVRVLCLNTLLAFALLACGQATSGTLILPTATPPQPTGSSAITPTLSGIPAFTPADVMKYVNTHNIPFNLAPLAQHSVYQITFLPSKQVNSIINRQNTHIPDSYLLCFVTFQGVFIFPGPPIKGKPTTTTYQMAYEVFDAKTGNLLMGGGLPAPLIT
jgi:hypothetical protein